MSGRVLVQEGRWRGQPVEVEATHRVDAGGHWTEVEVISIDDGLVMRTGWIDGHLTATDLWRLASGRDDRGVDWDASTAA